MKVYTSNYELVNIQDSPLASGGEGEIRTVISAPERFKSVCAKIYFPQGRTEQQKQKIKYMATNPPKEVTGEGFMIGWPLDYLTDANQQFLGFLMPLAFGDSIQLINLTSTRLPKSLGSEWYYRYDRGNGVSALLSRLKLINNISIPVYLLHATKRYVMKDFKPENVLVTATGKISMVDMDSIQIVDNGELLFPGNAATPNYIPPEYYTKNVGRSATDILNKSWDEFAIGIVFYQLLFGLHPYVVTPSNIMDDSSNDISQHISENLFPFGNNASKIASYPPLHDKFRILPDNLQALFTRAFSNAASNRPSASMWGRTVHEIILSAPKPAPPTISGPQVPVNNAGKGTSTSQGPKKSPSQPKPSTPTQSPSSSSSAPNPPGSKNTSWILTVVLIATVAFIALMVAMNY